MAISKQVSKSKSVCKVTFSLSADTVADAKDVAVLGNFNNWTPSALKKQKDGSFKTNVELTVGQEYEFRYLLNGSTWLNDNEADKFVSAGVSADENGVVVL